MPPIPLDRKFLIGLTGKMGSGKDSTYRILGIYLYPTIRLSIADPIKEELAEELNISLEELEQRKNESEFRILLQQKGEDVKKWTHIWAARYYKIPSGVIVVTDIRYLYNANCIREMGGSIVRVFKEPKKKAEVILQPEEITNHISEQEVDKIGWDYSIRNDGSMRYLQYEVKILANNLKEKWKI